MVPSGVQPQESDFDGTLLRREDFRALRRTVPSKLLSFL